ncbi:MAG: CvpA family protein [Spartobacteria bacterium]|nr:CvpA family protein [Spartobacteria bacterium]
MGSASPFWQNALLYGASLFLLWEIYGGWLRGVIRSGLHFGAFVLSGFLGMMVGQAIAAVVAIVMPGVSFFAGLGVGLAVTLFVLAVCLFLSAIVFKRTYQQPPGFVRTLFGLGGAFFGLLTGLFILWGTISLVRASGALAQSSMAGRKPKDTPALAQGLATLKESLEMGSIGTLVKSVDILPNEAYDHIVRLSKLTADPNAMMRFLDYPGVMKIVAHPRIQAILQDPELVAASEKHDYAALLRNPALMQAVSDPSLQKLVMGLDLQKALDYAMPPDQSPTTSKSKP